MDGTTFERVALAHKDRLYGYAMRMVRNPVEAQDVAQEALLRLWRQRDTIDETLARPWLLRTTHNLCIDRIRRGRHEAKLVEPDDGVDAAASGPSPLQQAATSELWRLVEEALGHLSAEDRTVLLLREVEDLSYEEIAESLSIPLGTLKARLHRARERLRGRLLRAGVAP
jgi:RNA polymerase sigma-70 factor (ECF subfamily)